MLFALPQITKVFRGMQSTKEIDRKVAESFLICLINDPGIKTSLS